MRFPIIHGMIKRRIFANFHLDPDTIPRILPDPFRNVPMIQLTCRSVLCIGILTQAISVSANDAPILWGRLVATGTEDTRTFRYAEWTPFLRIGGSIGSDGANRQNDVE